MPRAFGVVVAFLLLAAGVRAQDPPPVLTELSAADSAYAAGLEVWLVTIGQGDFVWEKFGHNALRIVDRTAGTDFSYNWGIFDFDEPGYLGRFVRGRMMYRMLPFDTERMVQAYIQYDRTVWFQQLDLSPAEKLSLQRFVEWNALPENQEYRYDYYRDNCSTRVRDALDRALGGMLRGALERRGTSMTYRSETQRLTAPTPVWYTALLYALGPYVDRPIDAWEASFVPMRLMEYAREMTNARGTPLVIQESVVYQSSRTPPPDEQPNWLLWFILAGVVAGALVLGLARAGRRSRLLATSFGLLAVVWSVLAGVVGSIVFFAWPLTDHVASFGNENLFQANPLSLVLAFLLPFALMRRPLGRWGFGLAVGVAGLAVLGFLLQVLPLFDQRNGEIIALGLPMHLGVLLGLWLLRSRESGVGSRELG